MQLHKSNCLNFRLPILNAWCVGEVYIRERERERERESSESVQVCEFEYLPLLLNRTFYSRMNCLGQDFTLPPFSLKIDHPGFSLKSVCLLFFFFFFRISHFYDTQQKGLTRNPNIFFMKKALSPLCNYYLVLFTYVIIY
jgi:hypothetical protein